MKILILIVMMISTLLGITIWFLTSEYNTCTSNANLVISIIAVVLVGVVDVILLAISIQYEKLLQTYSENQFDEEEY